MAILEDTRQPDETWQNGPPWWYGKMICDLARCGSPDPTWWWRDVLWDGKIVLLCEEGKRELVEAGIDEADFVSGRMIAPGVWRPV